MTPRKLNRAQIRLLKLAYSWSPMPLWAAQWQLRHSTTAMPPTGKIVATLSTCCQKVYVELKDAHRVYLDLDHHALRLIEDTDAIHDETGCTAQPATTAAFDIIPGTHKWRFDQ